MQKKLSYITFFPNDWLSDIHLHQCSIEARGVWMDLLCIMAKSRKYGYLINGDGKGYCLDTLASLIRINVRKLESCMAELEKEGIFKRDESGAIYSKRLVDDFNRIMNHRDGSRERMQRFRERSADKPSPKHSCESPAGPRIEISKEEFHARERDWYGLGSRENWIKVGKPHFPSEERVGQLLKELSC